ncbi:CRE-RIG-6 protein [Caenorhabditis remanei]|uniref:CRE-RIG-6 protein n=1 Tax=Caenorhabditis remanei TaxID=31234 RepID=E3M476_CAERE|nr:CRE-RIG-6 protein [Caenorhabditis remanei]
MRNYIRFLSVFLILSRYVTALIVFSDESSCPIGWQIASDQCVRIVISPANLKHAKKICHHESGELMDTSVTLLLDDVIDILKNLHENGLYEPTFHVGGMGQALNRTDDGNYKMLVLDLYGSFNIYNNYRISINPSSHFPFICSLNRMARRSLLFQQKLLPIGAPKISLTGQSEIYFHPRQDADYIALPCTVQGNPKPTVSWYKNDVEVLSPSMSNVSYLLSGGNLLVPASSSLAYSSFHCTAKNSLGEVRSPPILLKPSFIDPFRPHRLDVYSLATGGAKLDCDAPAHQPKSLTFSWLHGASTDRILSQNERKFISLDGTLFFSFVTSEDEDSYACSLSVYSTQSGHYGPFFRLISSTPKLVNSTFQPKLDSSQPQIFPEDPKIGDSIYLECFAYANPIPQYKWSRVDGKPLPPRSHISNYGRVLKIEKVNYGDAGKYKCVATNAFGAAAGEVHVKLRAPPSILQDLHDRLIPTESNVSFECLLSNADSYSSVEWFKDAKPIVPLLLPAEKRKRLRIDHNILHLKMADESDSGVYQCVVSNDVGSSSSSSLLTVKDSAPIFPPNAMPRKVFAALGSTVSIPCIFEASPRFHGKWADAGGSRLPQKGRIRDEDGIMSIEKVLHEDAGLFFCTAHNKLGKSHAQVQLIVMNKPSIKTNYLDEETVNMSCEVELTCENSAECPEALFEWKINDRPSKEYPSLKSKVHEKKSGHKGRHVKQKVDLEVPKSLAGRRQIGRFACSSLYGGSSELITKPQLPSPIALTVEQMDEDGNQKKKFRLKWRLPPQHRDTRDHSPKVEGYLVELRTRRNRKWRAAERQLVGNMEKDSITVENLLPNTEYQFRVRSVESAAIGDPSMPSDWVKTAPGAPSETIDNLKWRSLDSQTILVEWQPIEQGQESSGDNLRYRVSWSESTVGRNATDDMKSLNQDDDFDNHLDSDQSQAILKLNTTEGCRMVVLAVRPINDQGNGTVSTDTVAFLNSQGELKKVSLHNVKPINASHVNISWIWDTSSDCDTKHAVQITCLDLTQSEISATVASDRTFWMLGGLDAETAYDCDLKAIDNHGNFGPASKKFRIHTKQHPPNQMPIIGKLMMKQMKDSYTTILEWTAIDLQKPNRTENGCGYKIFIYISETATEAIELDMPVQRLSDRRNPSARLDGLKLMYMYTIKVAGYNSGGIGPVSDSRSIRLGSPGSMDYTSGSSLTSPAFLILVFMFWNLFH